MVNMVSRNNKSWRTDLILGLIVVYLGMPVGTSYGSGSPSQDMSSKREYLIDLEEQIRNQLLSSAKSIERGSSVDLVKTKLGPPTEDKRLIDKKGAFRFRSVTYYIRKRDRLVNEKTDRYVSFYFDESDKLVDIGFKLSEGPEAPNP
jgi:hypothetical protein